MWCKIIAVISDIHGNLYALENVVRELKNFQVENWYKKFFGLSACRRIWNEKGNEFV